MTLRELEAQSIRAFVQQAAEDGYLSGRVLDYGCGKAPFRSIVEDAGGEWYGYDRAEFAGNTSGEDIGTLDVEWEWDAVLSTQTLQYLVLYPYYDDNSVLHVVTDWWANLKPGEGHLVLTYGTNWPEVEPEDLHRFTKAGMERLLTEAGFEIVRHEERARVSLTPWEYNVRPGWGEMVALGYGCIARA